MVAQEEIFPVAAGHVIMLVVASTMKVVEDGDEMLGLTQEEVLNDSMSHAHLMWHVLNIVTVTHLVSLSSISSLIC